MAAAVVGGLVTQFDVVVACKLQQLMLQPRLHQLAAELLYVCSAVDQPCTLQLLAMWNVPRCC